MTPTFPETPAGFRAAIAYHNIRVYELAAAVGMHPGRLSLVLHGRAPLYPDVAERLRAAIERAAAA
jgi:hypothetical protein